MIDAVEVVLATVLGLAVGLAVIPMLNWIKKRSRATAADLSERPTVDVTTFGKWGPELEAVVGANAHLVLAGVATDCCVISTALAAADAGCTVTIVSDGCAGSSDENQAAALQVLGLYAPQITVVTAEELLG